jgi:hypothetical protein
MVSALAVAVSFVLVIFFSAVFEGESDQMVVYLEQTQADVWVMQKGVSNMHMASSMLWDWKADFIAKNPQVSEVAAILYLNGPIKAGGKDWFSYIIGLRPEHRRVGPWAMAEGKSIPGPGEAVIPEVITRLTGIGIGGEITMIDRKLMVVGLCLRPATSTATSWFMRNRASTRKTWPGKSCRISIRSMRSVATNSLQVTGNWPHKWARKSYA